MAVPFSTNMVLSQRFGGGVNSAASAEDISETECSSGQNFVLDLKNKNLKPRKPYKKLGTTPNGNEIRGLIGCVNSDGDATILVHAGTALYQWSQSVGFVTVAIVDASSKLRGSNESYWSLDDFTVITDLGLISNVLTWNGSAVAELAHNLGSDFKAKYCVIDNERAYFSNLVSNSTATPHLLAVSKLSDIHTLSVSGRSSSSLGDDDPYYLVTPDMRPVNNTLSFYENIIVSTEKGSLFKIVGNDASNMKVNKLYPRSAAVGDESMLFVGNDIFYGKTGRIESLVATDTYGDIAVDDLSAPIKPNISDLNVWNIAYNPRTQKVYFHAEGESHIWQYSKDMDNSGVSPWVKMTTTFGLVPTCISCMVDPDDNLEYTFIGDEYGNLYIIEGDAGELDAGENDITVTWRSGILKLPQELIASEFSGYISYKSGADTQVTLNFLFGGSYVSTSTHVIELKGSRAGLFFGGEGSYFGSGTDYFGTPFNGTFRRKSVIPAGASEEIQVELTHTGSADFEINEINLRFGAKTNP